MNVTPLSSHPKEIVSKKSFLDLKNKTIDDAFVGHDRTN